MSTVSKTDHGFTDGCILHVMRSLPSVIHRSVLEDYALPTTNLEKCHFRFQAYVCSLPRFLTQDLSSCQMILVSIWAAAPIWV